MNGLAQISTPSLVPDLVAGFVLLDVALILIAARVIGALFGRFGQPRVVGEITAGVLLGPTVLGPTIFSWGEPPRFLHCADALAGSGIDPSISSCLFPPQAQSVLGVLGQVALALFMFLVGLELDFRRLEGKGRGITTVAVGVVAVPIGLGFLIAPALYNSKFVGNFGTPDQPPRLAFALMVGAMLSVTAFPVMARILQEKRLTQSQMGSVGIAASAMTSVAMFLAIATAAAVARGAGGGELATKYVLTVVYVAVLFLVVRRLLLPLGRRYESTGQLGSTMFAFVLTLMLVSAYVADRLGLTVIVGAFLVGAILPAREGMFREFASRLSDMTAIVLLPIFLAFSGLRTDFTKLGISFVFGIGLFLAAGIIGKWAGGAVAARLGGLSWAEGNVIGILMNCRGLLVLVAALIAFNSGVISGQLQVGGVLMALITTIMTGPLFDRYLPRVTGEPSVATVTVIEELTATPRTYRVLVVVDDLDGTPKLIRAALGIVGDRPTAEIVACRVFKTGRFEEPHAERAEQVLRSMVAWVPSSIGYTPVVWASANPTGDVLALAQEQDCDVVLTGWQQGVQSEEAQRRLLDEAPCTVVLYTEQANGDRRPDGPVSLVDPDGASSAGDLAARVGTFLGQPVEDLDGEPGRLAEVCARSSALVVAVNGDGIDAKLQALAFSTSCPLFVVRPAPRPALVGASADAG